MALFLTIQIDWNQPCYERWIGSSVVARKHREKRRWNETRSKRKGTKRPTNGSCSQGCWIPRRKSFHTVGKIVILSHRTLSISHSIPSHRSLNLRSLSINLKKKKKKKKKNILFVFNLNKCGFIVPPFTLLILTHGKQDANRDHRLKLEITTKPFVFPRIH